MRRVLLVGFLALSIASVGGETFAVGPSEPLDQQLQTRIDAVRVGHGTVGVSVSVLLPGASVPRTVVSGSTRLTSGTSTPLSSRSVFPVGTITETMTAALVLLLAGDGKLSLDQRLATYLPEYPSWAGVTVRQLLNLTSGVSDYAAVPSFLPAVSADPTRRWSLRQLADTAYRSTPNTSFAPGQGWDDSSTNAVLAAMIVEKLTGRPFATELRERVLGPLGANLGGTFYASVLPALARARLVSGSNHDGRLPDGTDVSNYELSWAGPAGGAASDTPSIARWAQSVFGGAFLPSREQRELNTFVAAPSDETQPAAGRPTAATDPAGYTLGWEHGFTATTGPFWSKRGVALGHESYAMWIPCEEIALAVSKNDAAASSDAIVAFRDTALDVVLHSAEFAAARRAHPTTTTRDCPPG
jgi:D-alanyl-D-alanine carboxypeptidase